MKNSLFSLAILSLAMIGCSESKPAPAAAKKAVAAVEKVAEKATSAAKDLGDGVLALELLSDDNMKYNKSELKAKAGQKVTVTLKHTGKMPKSAMGHNFILLKSGTDVPAFATAAMAAKDNGYIPEGDAVIAHTDVIGGGETTSVTFTAPAKGTYDFICSFPGHYALMNGKFIVE